MRILILIALMLLSASWCMLAQDVSFGLKGGVNLANVSQGDISSQSVTSFHVGGFMEALYSQKIAVQPEIIYSQQGFTYNEGTIERRLRFSYINVPVMVKYFVLDDIFFEAGPQIGFLSTAKLRTKMDGDTGTRNIKEGLRSNDLSLNVGLGFKLNTVLVFNARYCYGLTNSSYRLTEDKFKNRVIQLSVGYFF